MKTYKRSEPEPATTLRKLGDRIQRRAYELYEARGRQDGRDLDDWLQAQSELTNTKRKVTAA